MGRMQTVATGFNPRAPRSRIEEQDEYVADVNGSVAFAARTFAVNPGNTTTFPWLSAIAKNFEKYRVVSLEFYYRREVSEFATNGQAGKVMLSFDADASDAAPTTKQQVEDTYPHADCMPCENLRLVIPPGICNDEVKKHFVRPGGLPGATDIRLYDVGNLTISTIGCTNGNLIGELRVKYKILLDVPILIAAAGVPANNSVSWFESTAPEAAGATTVAARLLLATAHVNGVVAVNTAGSIVLPAGNYIVDAAVLYSNNTGVTTGSLDIQKNGVTIWQTVPEAEGFGNGYVTTCAFITSNGTDAFTFIVIQTYAAGASTNSGSVRFTAI
jgi:hypothetical protein